jgi:hypothetical protein
MPMAHTASAALFDLHHTPIGKVAINKFGIGSQWRSELLR